MKPLAYIAACLALIAFATSITARASTPPVAAIASDLGVGVDDLVACTMAARSHAEGPRGSDARKASVRALVLACLQETRPNLTPAELNAAIAKYRAPGGTIID